MKIAFLSILLTLFFSCAPKKEKDRNIEIIIKYGQSYTYDLNKCIYIVFVHGSSIEIKFKLSNDEKNMIIDKYFELGIDKISGKVNKETGNIYFEDKCGIMPKLYTLFQVKTKESFREFQIDTSCNEFYSYNKDEAKRIKKNLQFIEEILKAKPEIKNAPKSDIIYM